MDYPKVIVDKGFTHIQTFRLVFDQKIYPYVCSFSSLIGNQSAVVELEVDIPVSIVQVGLTGLIPDTIRDVLVNFPFPVLIFESLNITDANLTTGKNI